MRLGLTMGSVALRMSVWMNDVLLGTPSLATLESGVGAINPNAVNIMTTRRQRALQHAEKMKQIALDDVTYIEGAEHISRSPKRAGEVAKRVVELAIGAFKERKRRERKEGMKRATVDYLTE